MRSCAKATRTPPAQPTSCCLARRVSGSFAKWRPCASMPGSPKGVALAREARNPYVARLRNNAVLDRMPLRI